jgi:cytochrome c-type biogenesis protein CcmF
VLVIGGIRQPAALLGFWLTAFVSCVTLYEFWRGVLARRFTSNESLPLALWRLAGRNRRRYGGYVIHLGVVLMAIGIIGMGIYQTETQGTIPQGGQLTLGKYSIRFDKLDNWDTQDGRNVARAVLSVFKNGQYIGELYPRRDYYYESQQPMTIPGIRSTLEDDLYVILVDWQPVSTLGATFKVFHNSLVNWLWFGGIIFIFGTLIAAWPDKDPETEAARVRRVSMTEAKA